MKPRKVHNLNPQELNQIVNLHLEVLPESFINNFGKNFLRSAYDTMAKDPNNIFLLLKQDEQVIGFLVAAKDGGKFTRNVVLKLPFQTIRNIFIQSLRQPLLVLLLIRWLITSIGHKFRIKTDLKYIAIQPGYQGRGLGSRLIKQLEQVLIKSQIGQFLVGTKAANLLSNRFYRKLDFEKIGERKFFDDSYIFYLSPKFAETREESNFSVLLPSLITLLFLTLFIFQSVLTMRNVPFYDFDEAHRAENAKRMKEYGSYFVPLTGSSFDRVEHLRVPLRGDPSYHLYYHLERPFFVYLTMIGSITLFGSNEWAYRLPSFLFGISILLLFFMFLRQEGRRFSAPAFFVGFLSLVTSADLWLSSQYAQMDTGITLFLFASLIMIIKYIESRNETLLVLSGISFSLAVLSKGQPTVIFIFPLFFLLLIKKLALKELLRFIGFASILLLPWLGYLIYRFGVKDVFETFSGFAIYSASIIYIHTIAPAYWYIRWWWESLRPGWTLFLALMLYDLIKKRLNWQKGTLLIYVLGGLIAFSIPTNKIWWYVLPLIPPLTYYIYLSSRDYLKERGDRTTNLALIIFIGSLPFFLKSLNRWALTYGLIITLVSLMILNVNFKKIDRFLSYKAFILSAVLLLGLLFFYIRFPSIIPYHWNTKPVSLYYKNLPGKKCLWAYDMPTEAAIFYSEAGELPAYNDNVSLAYHCKNYVITPEKFNKGKLLFQRGSMKLFELEH